MYAEKKTTKKPKKKLLQEKERDYKKNKLFRRIEADIKDRDRRRTQQHKGKQVKYQEYVDQSRVISVCLGPPDIRTSMLKQRMFLNRSVFFMKEEQQGHKIFVEQAMHEMHRGAFDLAVYYLRRAIRLNPNDHVTHVERAACYLGLAQYEKALADANEALALGSKSAKALYIKGDALHNLGNFEHALVLYHRALKRAGSATEEALIRGKITQTVEAIENAVGLKSAAHFMTMPAVLNKIPATIFGLPWHELKSLHKEEITSSEEKKKKHRRKLLGKMSTDLEYLEELLTEVKLNPPAIVDSQNDIITTDEIVTKEAEEGISFLKERQEFWSQFQPLYCK